MKIIWEVFSWLAMICALGAYLIGWIALFTKTTVWNISTEFWFYDAIVAGIFAIFFLVYGLKGR